MDKTPPQSISSSSGLQLPSNDSRRRTGTERGNAKPFPARAQARPHLPSTSSPSILDYDRSARTGGTPFNTSLQKKSFIHAASKSAGDNQKTVVSPKVFLDMVIKARQKPPAARLNGLLLAAHRMDIGTTNADARILLAEAILTLENCWAQTDTRELIDTLAGRANYPTLSIDTDEVARLADPDVRRITVFNLLASAENGPIRFSEKDIQLSVDGLSAPLAVSLTNSAVNAVLQNDLEQLRIVDVPRDSNAGSMRTALHEALKTLDDYGTKAQDNRSITFSRADTAHFGAIKEDPGAVDDLKAIFGKNGTSALSPLGFSEMTRMVKSLPERAILPPPGDTFWNNLATNLERNLRELPSQKNVPLGWIAILAHIDRHAFPTHAIRLDTYSSFPRIAQVALTLLGKSNHVSGNDLAAIVSAYKYALPIDEIEKTYKQCISRVPPMPGEMRIGPKTLGTIVEGFRFASIATQDQKRRVANSRSDPTRDLRKSGLAAKLMPYIREAHFDNVNDVCKLLRGAVGIHYSLTGEICEFILERGLLDCSPDRALTPWQLKSLAGTISALPPAMSEKMAQLLTQHITTRDTTVRGAMQIIERIGFHLGKEHSDPIVKALLPTLRKSLENNSYRPSNNDILTSMKILSSVSPKVAEDLGEVWREMFGRGEADSVEYRSISFAMSGAAYLPVHLQAWLAPHLATYLDKITDAHSRAFYFSLPVVRDTTVNLKLREVARTLIERAPVDNTTLFLKGNVAFNVLLKLGSYCKDDPMILKLLQEVLAKAGYKVPAASQLVDPEHCQALVVEALSATTHMQLKANVPCIDLHGADEESASFILTQGTPQWKQMQGEELVISYGSAKHSPRNLGKMNKFAQNVLESLGIPKAAIQDTNEFEHPKAAEDKLHYTNSLLVSRKLAWPPASKPETPTRKTIGKMPTTAHNFGSFGGFGNIGGRSTSASLQTRQPATRARDAKLAAAKKNA